MAWHLSLPDSTQNTWWFSKEGFSPSPSMSYQSAPLKVEELRRIRTWKIASCWSICRFWFFYLCPLEECRWRLPWWRWLDFLSWSCWWPPDPDFSSWPINSDQNYFSGPSNCPRVQWKHYPQDLWALNWIIIAAFSFCQSFDRKREKSSVSVINADMLDDILETWKSLSGDLWPVLLLAHVFFCDWTNL